MLPSKHHSPFNRKIMKKIEFEKVFEVYEALTHAFHEDLLQDPEQEGKEVEPDQKMLSLWILFLLSAGWDEDEFWKEVDSRATDDVPQELIGKKLLN